MKIITSALEAMAALPSQYPTEELPEIAFAGRSNVGKSTLINSLCQRKKLAYTSATPGKRARSIFIALKPNGRKHAMPFAWWICRATAMRKHPAKPRKNGPPALIRISKADPCFGRSSCSVICVMHQQRWTSRCTPGFARTAMSVM